MAHHPLSGHEFMRRFVQHVLPKGLHKVRYYGLWHSTRRELAGRARLMMLLQTPPCSNLETSSSETTRDPADRSGDHTPPAERRACPCCKEGHLIHIGRLYPKQRAGHDQHRPSRSDHCFPRMCEPCHTRYLSSARSRSRSPRQDRWLPPRDSSSSDHPSVAAAPGRSRLASRFKPRRSRPQLKTPYPDTPPRPRSSNGVSASATPQKLLIRFF
jgi:Putative transposase